MERGSRQSSELHLHERGNLISAEDWKVAVYDESREVSSSTTSCCGMESIWSKDGYSRGFRHVQRLTRRVGIPRGPECTVQSDLHHCGRQYRRFESSDQAKRARPIERLIDSRRRSTGYVHSDGGILVAENRARAVAQYVDDDRVYRKPWLSRTHRTGRECARSGCLSRFAVPRYIS